MADTSAKQWWKDAVCYQIYPASFKDSNGDGLGDIPGILSKVDYLKDLGIDIVWVSPMYSSHPCQSWRCSSVIQDTKHRRDAGSTAPKSTWDMTSPTTRRSTPLMEQSKTWRLS